MRLGALRLGTWFFEDCQQRGQLGAQVADRIAIQRCARSNQGRGRHLYAGSSCQHQRGAHWGEGMLGQLSESALAHFEAGFYCGGP